MFCRIGLVSRCGLYLLERRVVSLLELTQFGDGSVPPRGSGLLGTQALSPRVVISTLYSIINEGRELEC